MRIFSLTFAALILGISLNSLAKVETEIDLTKPEEPALSLSELQRRYANERFRHFSELALAAYSGADIVGNGGGYIEQNFRYIYHNLDRTISQCLSVPYCAGNIEDRNNLRAIRDVVLKYREQKNRIVFLAGSDFENFFNSELDPGERVAKTGFSPEFPIFINLSLIEEMSIGSDLSLILGILAHEIGHQVGVSSHSYLDSLASRLRSVFYDNTLTIELTQTSLPLKFMVLKARKNYAHDEAVLTAGGEVIEMPRLASHFQCPRQAELLATTLSNPHWSAPTYRNAGLEVKVEAWGEFSCSDEAGNFNVERRTVIYNIRFDRKISNEGKVVFTKSTFSLITK